MPYAAKRPCGHPSCPETIASGSRCEQHRKQQQRAEGADRRRRQDGPRIYGTVRWQKVRLMVLARDCSLCAECKRRGRDTPANEVDHIVSIVSGGVVFDMDNLQSLCKPCHSRKTAIEDGGMGNR